ncbi:MAG: hypothetical protein WCT54_05100 [Patescibacteria group bacterium]|jgi:hypothetical protein
MDVRKQKAGLEPEGHRAPDDHIFSTKQSDGDDGDHSNMINAGTDVPAEIVTSEGRFTGDASCATSSTATAHNTVI